MHLIIQIHQKLKDIYLNKLRNINWSNKDIEIKEIEKLSNVQSIEYIKHYTYSLSQRLKEEKEIDNNIYDFKIYFHKKIYRSNHECLILCYINIDKIYEYVKIGLNIPNRILFFTLLKLHYFYKSKSKKKELIDIKSKEYDVNQWNDLNLSKYFNNIFYNYQIENILWMLDNESNNKIKLKYYKPNTFHLYKDLYVDMYYNRILFESDIEEIKFQGGILCGEPGLGKSLCSIALSELNYKVDIFHHFKFKSNATLIITSNDMALHWIYLIQKYVKRNRKIITIISKRDFKKYTYKDILESDYVIFSLNFMVNNKLYKKISEYQNPYNSYVQLEHVLYTVRLEKERDDDIYNKNEVLPFIIYWKRIIYDKVIERSNDLKYTILKKYLLMFHSYYNWVLEDQIKNEKDLKYIIEILINKNINISENLITLNKNINEFIRVNKKDNIKKELKYKNIDRLYINLKYNEYEKELINRRKNYFNDIFRAEYPNLSILDKNEYNEIILNDYLNNIIDNDYKLNLIDKYNNNNLECCICFNNINNNNTLFYKCGHYNCMTCYKMIDDNNKKCPICRIKLIPNELFILKNCLNNKERKNTKIIKLKEILEKSENKCILISYSEKVFEMIKKEIKKEILVCKGSYIQKNFIINRFNDIKENCIFCCSYNSCENLQKVNGMNINIIYLSPLNISEIFYKHKFLLLNNILTKMSLKQYYLYYNNSIEENYINNIRKELNEQSEIVSI